MLNPSANKANKGEFLYGPLSFLRKSNRRKDFLLGGKIVASILLGDAKTKVAWLLTKDYFKSVFNATKSVRFD